MSNVYGYAAGIVAVCAVVSLAAFVSYRGECDGAAKGALALIMLSAVALPLSSLSVDISFSDISIDELLPSGEAEYESVGKEALETGLRRLIAGRFSLSEEDITVTVDGYDFSAMRAERIRVLLSGRAAAADIVAIRNYVTEQGIGECEVDIEI